MASHMRFSGWTSKAEFIEKETASAAGEKPKSSAEATEGWEKLWAYINGESRFVWALYLDFENMEDDRPKQFINFDKAQAIASNMVLVDGIERVETSSSNSSESFQECDWAVEQSEEPRWVVI